MVSRPFLAGGLMSALAGNIAKNIKQLRSSRNLSQEQLAKLSGIPRPTWSYLESGEANPTIAVLSAVSSALQVSIEELIGAPRGECQFYSAEKIVVQRRTGVLIRKLLPEKLPSVEFDRIELPPGTRMAGIPHRLGTREYLTCEKGKIEITVSGEKYDLSPGDVVAFRGDQRHSYANHQRTDAVGFSVVMLAAPSTV